MKNFKKTNVPNNEYIIVTVTCHEIKAYCRVQPQRHKDNKDVKRGSNESVYNNNAFTVKFR